MRKTHSLTGESGSRSPVHGLMLGQSTGDGSFGSLRGNMEFGVFDHLDRTGSSLAEFYESRLRIAEAYDRAGFYAYHLAEHHSTPLGMAPSPSVFLSSVAQRTRRLRFGPLVWAMPLHHPLRLIEEICMLDQMSGGRLEIGFGRGSVPIEIEYYGADPAVAQEIYAEAVEIVLKGLTQKVLDHRGKHFTVDNVPMELEPLQKPHPPIWYGVHMPDSAERAARRKLNVVSLDPPAETRLSIDALPRGLGADAARRYAAAQARPWPLRRGGADRRRGAGAGAPRLSGLACELHVSIPPPRPLAVASAARDLRSGDGARAGHRGLAEHCRGRRWARSSPRPVATTWSGQFTFGDLTSAECLRSIGLFAERGDAGTAGADGGK